MSKEKTVDRRVTRSIRAIEDAYFDILTTKDPERITISEIARKADIDRKTFYLHYSSTDEILEKIADRKSKELMKKVKEETAKNTSVSVRKIFDLLHNTISEDVPLYRQVAKVRDNSLFWLRTNTYLENILLEICDEFIHVDKDVKIPLVKLFSAGLLNVYRSWLRHEIDMDFSTLGNIIEKSVLNEMRF